MEDMKGGVVKNRVVRRRVDQTNQHKLFLDQLEAFLPCSKDNILSVNYQPTQMNKV